MARELDGALQARDGGVEVPLPGGNDSDGHPHVVVTVELPCHRSGDPPRLLGPRPRVGEAPHVGETEREPYAYHHGGGKAHAEALSDHLGGQPLEGVREHRDAAPVVAVRVAGLTEEEPRQHS